jgi:hypothetical protein
MEKMSRFINFVPTLPNPEVMPEVHHKRRTVQRYSRFRRFRGRRRINNRVVTPSITNHESTTVEEISDEVKILFSFYLISLFWFQTTTEVDNQLQENIEIPQEQNESIPPNVTINDPPESIVSTTITIEKDVNPIDELSSIEKVDTTDMIDHTSTLLISSTNNSCSTS